MRDPSVPLRKTASISDRTTRTRGTGSCSAKLPEITRDYLRLPEMTREESRLTARAGRAPARRSGGKIPDNLAKSRKISGHLGLLRDDQVGKSRGISGNLGESRAPARRSGRARRRNHPATAPPPPLPRTRRRWRGSGGGRPVLASRRSPACAPRKEECRLIRRKKRSEHAAVLRGRRGSAGLRASCGGGERDDAKGGQEA